MSAAMPLDIVHELVGGSLGGNIGRLICPAMAIQRGQDHMVGRLPATPRTGRFGYEWVASKFSMAHLFPVA